MPAAIIATQLQTPDTTRAYTISIGPGADVTTSVAIDSLEFEDQGTGAQGTTSFRINGKLVDFPQVTDQALVSIYDHVSDSQAYRGFIDSRHPARQPLWDQIEVTSSDHTSLLDNVIPLENRPAGEGDAARIGYLWGKYAGSYLQGSMAFVQSINSNLPAQIFASVSLRQALDLICAQASTSAVWYLDSTGQLHYFTSETNNAPYNVTSDTPGGGEISPSDLEIDYDSKSYASAVYVRGKTDAGSGWVYSGSASLSHNGLQRTTFLDAPDCTTAAMRNALGNMYLGRLGAAVNRGSFSTVSPNDGWRAGQNVTVRSTHLGNINQAFRIARVRTKVLGLASKREYAIEFGGARAGTSGGSGSPIVGTALVGDILDETGNLLLGTGSDASTSGLGPAIRRYIMSGVYNGDFALTPPLADATIVDAYNPLPFWSFVLVGGTSISAASVADSTSGSGRVVQFQMDAGGIAGDDAYLEQIVPVNGSRSQTYLYQPLVTFVTGPTVSAAMIYIDCQYLKADGTTTTGNAGTSSPTTTSFGAGVMVALGPNGLGTSTLNMPTDAYYLRIRVGFKRDVAATTVAETVTLVEVVNEANADRLRLPETSSPGTYQPSLIRTNGGDLQITIPGDGSTVGDLSLVNGAGLTMTGAFSYVPSGTIFAYGAAAAPTGFLLCDGTSYLRTTYANLFAVIGTTYGSADGTHFNVPDFRDKILIGGTPGTGGGTISPAAALTTHGTHTHQTPLIGFTAGGTGIFVGGSSTGTSFTVTRAVSTTASSGTAPQIVTTTESAALTHPIYKNALAAWIIKT